MEHAGMGIRHVSGDHADLEVFHKLLSCRTSALDTEGDHTAGAVRHIFLRPLKVFVGRKAGVIDPGDLLMLFEEFSCLLGILAVPGHADRQGLDPQVQIKGIHRRLDGSQVAHQLRSRLGDVGAALTEFLCIGDPVIGLIRCGQSRELVRVGKPVEIPAVHDTAADCGRQCQRPTQKACS